MHESRGVTTPAQRLVKAVAPASPSVGRESVLGVRHWTERLFTFTVTRNPGFRFESGQFAMLGLEVNGRLLLRPYSMASAHYDETLEFVSVKVPHGALTSRLQHIVPGETVMVGRKATGTLVLDSLLPGRTLYLFGTGTGIAPFLSLIKDPTIYMQFERVVLTHTCRKVTELRGTDCVTSELPAHQWIGELVREQLIYYPSVTREPFRTVGRVTQLLEEGRIHADLGLLPLDSEVDRAMVCGSMAFLADMSAILFKRGFREGSLSRPGTFDIEKAFVER